MSERNWGLIVAAGFGVVTFSAMGGFVLAGQTYSERQQAEASDSAARNKGGRPQQADTDHAGVPALAERIISNPEPGDGTEREKRDLAAQENTAAWAFWIVLFTAVQAILSGFGIYFIVKTLRHSQDVSYSELRAYVFPGGFTVTRESGGTARVDSCLRNSGQTPARKVSVKMGAEIVDYPFRTPLPDTFGLGPIQVYGIGPNTERTLVMRAAVTDEEWKALGERKKALLARLQYSYTTYTGEIIREPTFDVWFQGQARKDSRMNVVSVNDYEGRGERSEPEPELPFT